jgi:hypothetical protein
MSADLASMKQSLARLRQERADLETIRKEAFMAAPPMPGGGMPPGMDPSMMQGGMPSQGMPVDPNTGMPMDPSMMQGGMPPQGMPPGMDPSMMQGGMLPQGMPPGMDPSMMQGGMPPQGMPVDPNTGMPMDPSMMQGGMPPQQQPPPASPITPEMLEEIIGVIEQLAAGSEQHEKEMQGMKQQLEDVMANFDELEQRLAQMFSGPQQGM